MGVKVANTDSELLQSMLTELLSYSGSSSNLFEFGEGCAEGTHNNEELLALTISTLEKFLRQNETLTSYVVKLSTSRKLISTSPILS